MKAALRSPARRAIVGCLDAAPAGQTAAELAKSLNLHVTTIRFHLNILQDAGLVSTATRNQSGVGRPNKTYHVVRDEVRPSPDGYGVMAELVASVWRDEARAKTANPETIGATWAVENLRAPLSMKYPVERTPGIWLAKVGVLVDLLNSIGYHTEISTSKRLQNIELTIEDCPFSSMAATNPDVICALHRGLMRGALDSLGEESAHLTLSPLVAPNHCCATLTLEGATS